MSDTTDNLPGPDEGPASLTRLWTEFGALWEITRNAQGYEATRRPHPVPPIVLTAQTAPALRELLAHGYDTAQLAAIMRDFAGWDVEHVDPGTAWIAISRDDPAGLVTAASLVSLRDGLSRAPGQARHDRR
jgi:hypothetical protein